MHTAIQLYGSLIISFLGFIAPITGILLSIFREGISTVATQYENERLKSETNIKEQLKKQGTASRADIAMIQKSLNELRTIIKIAEMKLEYLNPNKQIPKLFALLLLSFFGTLFSLIEPLPYSAVSLFISIVCFTTAINLLWKLLGIMVEAKRVIDDNKKEQNKQIAESLSLLVKKFTTGISTFITNVIISINGIPLDDDKKEISLTADTKHEIKIAILNREKRMAKNVEIGFVFPLSKLAAFTKPIG